MSNSFSSRSSLAWNSCDPIAMIEFVCSSTDNTKSSPSTRVIRSTPRRADPIGRLVGPAIARRPGDQRLGRRTEGADRPL